MTEWTEEEDRILRKRFPYDSPESLVLLLKKSWHLIKERAKELGIERLRKFSIYNSHIGYCPKCGKFVDEIVLKDGAIRCKKCGGRIRIPSIHSHYRKRSREKVERFLREHKIKET